MTPDESVYSLRDFYRATVPAFAAGEAGELGPFTFVFPSPVEVSGILVMPADGTPESLAALSVAILDENDEQIFSDARGVNAGGQVSPFAAPCLGLAGRAFKRWPLTRVVRPHDRWIVTLQNFSGVDVTVASVAIFFRSMVGR